MTIRLDDMRGVVEGGTEDTLDDDLSTVALEEMDEGARSEVLDASLASDGSMGVFEETARGDTMQCAERDENGVTAEPSKDSSGTMITSFCEAIRDELFGDNSNW